MLIKAEDESALRGETIEFVTPDQVNLWEWRKKRTDECRRLSLRAVGWVLRPLALLGFLVKRISRLEHGRWPLPTSSAGRSLLAAMDDFLGGLYNIVGGIFACALVGIGAHRVIHWLITRALEAATYQGGTDLFDAIWWKGFVPFVYAVFVSVSILLSLAVVLAVMGNFVLLRAARRLLYGLVTTYVSGTSAPAWTRDRGNIIGLSIPEYVTTLSFDIGATYQTDLIEWAKVTTAARLKEILFALRGQKKNHRIP